MSDEIKRVTYEVAAVAAKNNRRSRKNLRPVQLSIAPGKPVAVPKIKVNDAIIGGAVLKPVVPVSSGSPVKPTVVTTVATGGAPLPILSTTTAVGGKKPEAKHIHETKKVDVKQSHTDAKPSVKVPLPYNNSPNTPTPTKVSNNVANLPLIKLNKNKVIATRKVEPPKVKVVSTKKKNVTLKAKFVAKRIIVKIENSSKVRKTRDAIRRKVANMALAEITQKLRSRGLVRPSVNPPEQMQRAMMVDIMLFPTPL